MIEIKEGPDAGLAVDTGFIVLNDATYPLFRMFLARLGVEARVSEMFSAYITSHTQHSLSMSKLSIRSLVSSDKALNIFIAASIVVFSFIYDDIILLL